MAKANIDTIAAFPPPARRAEWFAAIRAMPPRERLPMIAATLKALPEAPTTDTVFFRKQLLRLQDESRVQAGMVTPAELQRENSPFSSADFIRAKVNFRTARHV